jgi:hypothetical protein
MQFSPPARLRECHIDATDSRGLRETANKLLLGALSLLWVVTFCSIAKAQELMTSQEFIGRIGVNVHFMYTDGGYAKLDKSFAALRYMGLSQVRDALPELNWEGEARYRFATDNGITFDLFVDGTAKLSTTLARLDQFATHFPGHIDVIEGPNEINNWPVKYGSLSGTQAAVALQTDLYRAIRSDALLKMVPVYNYTGFPDAGGQADFTNIHPYSKQGAQPRPELERNLDIYSRLTPGKPVVVTETGYPTLQGKSSWGGIDGVTQAKLTLNLLFDAAALGIRRTYIYQLLDAYPDSTGTEVDKHLGLFDLQYQPKPAAHAIHNLTTILKGSAGGNVSAAAVSFTITGLPSSAKSLSIRRSDGSTVIAIWDEPKIWDSDGLQPIPHAKVPIAVQFSAPVDMAYFDPLGSEAPIASARNTAQIQLGLDDRPLLVAVSYH